MGHFDPFPPARPNGRCPFRRYVLVPWSAARPDVIRFADFRHCAVQASGC